MQKNLYYRTVFRRQNMLKDFFLNLFIGIGTFFRMLLEVFIRKNFGERYFSLFGVVFAAIILALFPLAADRFSYAFGRMFGGGNGGGGEGAGFWGQYASWYLFLVAFVFFSYLRWLEVRRNPSVFDFARFSLYTGDIHPRFYQPPLLKTRPSIRMVEIIWEPALFLVIGIILKLVGQSLGTLLIVSSIFYSLSYVWAYDNGDNFVMDKIDEMILNEEMAAAFVDNKDADRARGVRFYARKPNSKEDRERVTETFIEDDDDITEAK